jgi:putative oligomerization/nucleic acid binding protein
VLALTAAPRYGEGVSLRRLRYQLECRRSGHDVRPYMADGSRVVQRCLRCGAIVDEADLSLPAEAAADLVPPRRPEPQPSTLPPAPAERRTEPGAEVSPVVDVQADAEAEEAEGGDDALAALTALRELGELHSAGVLTDREFACKKAELLRRV